MFVPPIIFTLDDGTKVTAYPKPIDVMLAEREYGESMATRKVESSLFLGWSALRRQGEPRPLDVWAATVVDLEFLEADAVDPTSPALSPDSPPA